MTQKSTTCLVLWWPANRLNLDSEALSTQSLCYKIISNTGLTLETGHKLLNQLPKTIPCMVLVNPLDLLLIAIKPPKTPSKKLKNALPFIAEPHLLNNPEDNYYQLWPHLLDSEDEALLSIISKKTIQTLLRVCAQYSIAVKSVSCESLLKCSKPCAWVSQETLILVDQLKPPSVFDLSQITWMKPIIQKRLQSERETKSNQCWLIHQKDFELLNSNFSELLTIVDNQNFKPDLYTLINHSLLDKEDSQGFDAHLNNTFTGTHLNALLKPTFVFVSVFILGINILAYRANQQQNELKQLIKTTFQRVMPNTPLAADPVLLMQQRQAELMQGQAQNPSDSFTYLFHQVGISLEHLPFNSLEQIEWNNNELVLDFSENVTPDMHEQAIRTLQTHSINGKWAQTSQEMPFSLIVQLQEQR